MQIFFSGIVLALLSFNAYALPVTAINLSISSWMVILILGTSVSLKAVGIRVFVLALFFVSVTSSIVLNVEESRIAQKVYKDSFYSTNEFDASTLKGKLPESINASNTDYIEATGAPIGSLFGDRILNASDLDSFMEIISKSNKENILLSGTSTGALSKFHTLAQTTNKTIYRVPMSYGANTSLIPEEELIASISALPEGTLVFLYINSYQELVNEIKTNPIGDAVKVINRTMVDYGVHDKIETTSHSVILSAGELREEEKSRLRKLFANTVPTFASAVGSEAQNLDGKTLFEKRQLSESNFGFLNRNVYSENFINTSQVDAIDRVKKQLFVCFNQACTESMPRGRYIDLSGLGVIGVDFNKSDVDELLAEITEEDYEVVTFVVDDYYQYIATQVIERVALSEEVNLDMINLTNGSTSLYTNLIYDENVGMEVNNDGFTNVWVKGVQFTLYIASYFDELHWEVMVPSIFALIFLFSYSMARGRYVIASISFVVLFILYYWRYLVINMTISQIDMLSENLVFATQTLSPIIVLFAIAFRKAQCAFYVAVLYLYQFIYTDSTLVSIDLMFLDLSIAASILSYLALTLRDSVQCKKGFKLSGFKSGQVMNLSHDRGVLISGTKLTKSKIEEFSKDKDIIIRSDHMTYKESASAGEFNSYIVRTGNEQDINYALNGIKEDMELLGERFCSYWVQEFKEYHKTGVAQSINPKSVFEFNYSIGLPECVTSGSGAVRDVSASRFSKSLCREAASILEQIKLAEKSCSSPVIIEFGVLVTGKIELLQVKKQDTSWFLDTKLASKVINLKKLPELISTLKMNPLSESVLNILYAESVLVYGGRAYQISNINREDEKVCVDSLMKDVAKIFSRLQQASSIEAVYVILLKNNELFSRLMALKSESCEKDDVIEINNCRSLIHETMLKENILYLNEFDFSNSERLTNYKMKASCCRLAYSDLHHDIMSLIFNCIHNIIDTSDQDVSLNKTMLGNVLGLPESIVDETDSEVETVVSGSFPDSFITFDDLHLVNEQERKNKTLVCETYPCSLLSSVNSFGAIVSKYGSNLSHVSVAARFYNIPYRIDPTIDVGGN